MTTIFVFDTETSDIPKWKIPSDDPKQPHIVSVAGLLVDVDTKKIVSALDVIVRPNGWTISEDSDAFKIHGITQEYAMDVGIPELVAADMVMALAEGRTRVAFNTTFDNRMIRIALKRFFSVQTADAWRAGEYECAMQLARNVMGVKSVKLVDAYKHFTGKELVNAHNAMADTLAAMDVYFAAKAKLPGESKKKPPPVVKPQTSQTPESEPKSDLEF